MYGKVKTTVIGTGKFEIEIDREEAFRLLCDSLHMDFFYKDDFDDYLILKDENSDEECAYIYKRMENDSEITDEGEDDIKEAITYHGKKYIYFDERGNTFLALYKLAEQVFMGLDSILVENYSDFC